MTNPTKLKLNGSATVVEVAADETLLTTLRDTLRLTGAKRGCNQGVCGACTVLVDGRPVRSCLSLTANCEDQEVLTVEAFTHDRVGSALQEAFAGGGAVQCGFCTPGMLVVARQVLLENPHPSPDEVRAGISGNLCRCSGYKKIVDAVLLAAQVVGND